ncbi:hypothetical protein Tco_1525532 [Tanacetum coccineum]
MASNEETNAAGTDTRPPMLVESDYESWKKSIHRRFGKMWRCFMQDLVDYSSKKEGSVLMKYERFRAWNEINSELLCAFHKLVNDKYYSAQHSTHQMNTKFANNLRQWGKYVTIANRSWNISTHLSSYLYSSQSLRAYAKKTLKKQSSPYKYCLITLAFVAHTTAAPALSSPRTPISHPPTTTLRTSSNSRTHATVHDGHIVTEPVQRKASKPKRKMDSQYFKDKALLMEAKEKGDVLDAEAEAFLADVECTAPYDQPQALTTTNMFQANHEDAYDSDVDEGPNAAIAFMANLSSTSATNNPVNEVHSNDNQIFDNVDYQIQEMHQEEHLDPCLNEIDDKRSPESQYRLDTEAQNVQLRYPKGKEKSIAFLQSEKEKILSEKKELADSYLDEIVCLKNANKVARDMLQRFNMPTQTIPMLSKKPKAATADLHKDLLGTRNPGLGYMAKRAQPVLYDADTLLHPTHHPVSIWDSEEVLVHQVVSMKKMSEKPGHVRPANGFYDKLNAMMFVPQKELSREQAYWLPANEIASQASTQ